VGAESRSGVDLPGVDDAWERHAGWWQEGFTDGADPEYEEQILPLTAEWLAGAERVLDVGTGEGQLARLAVKGGAGLVLGVDPRWRAGP
jgi:SAM-dependent methyltransferase